ncbi:UNVERIFIED_CONTAM: hypothetical protein FKN15_048406 [Acipenser sinensis]
MEKLDCYMPRLLSLFKKKGGAAGVKLQGIQEMLYGSNTVEKRRETVIRGLIIYLSENVKDLMKEYQTTTPENIELAMQLVEIQLRAAGDTIDTYARAVENVVAAKRRFQMKTSMLTVGTQAKVLELPFEGDLLFGTGLKDSLSHMKEMRQPIRSCLAAGRDSYVEKMSKQAFSLLQPHALYLYCISLNS